MERKNKINFNRKRGPIHVICPKKFNRPKSDKQKSFEIFIKK